MWRYTSDLHFGHPFVAGLRGFTTLVNGEVKGDAAEHDGVITENFNQGVHEDDITVIAGDFAMNWKGAEHKLAQLRGRIILVEGNHDIMSSIHRDGWKHRAAWTGEDKFEAIVAYLRRKSAGREFLVSHYPYDGDHTGNDRHTQFRLRDEGMWLVHGHTHSKDKITPLPEVTCMFCGLDMTKEACGDAMKGTDLEGQGCERLISRQIHAGVDAWDLKPVPEAAVLDLMNSLDSRPEG
jgi:calcineurin-like phosphoesterase family protein